MAEKSAAGRRSVGIIVAIVAVAAVFGVEVDGESAETAKDAAATTAGGIGLLIAFGKDLLAKLKG